MISRALCPILVGREQELSRLEDALLAALRGEGSVIALAGDAGVGKSRLCGEVEARARKLGATVLSGSCSEAELALPYLPFLEAIGNHLERADTDALRERLGPAARQLGNLFPKLSAEQMPAGDATEAKLRLFEAVLALLGELARESGLLLIVEDLHWADASTRELIDYVTRRVSSSRMLVLATYRGDEMHRKHPLLPTIQGWQRARLAEVVDLEPLPPDGVRRMVSAIFDDTQVGAEFRDFMHQRTEGNPFVVEEMLKAALDRGDIYRTDEGWDRRPISQLQIPETVRDTILLRLERLDDAQAEVLRAASVLGRSFDHRVLMRMTAVSAHELETALQAATLQQLIEEQPGGGYRFRHALTQEAIYEDLSAPKRERLHAAAAEAVPDDAVADRAHHLIAARRTQEAVPAALAAADGAIARHGYAEAARLFEAVLPAVHRPLERGRLLCRLGETYRLAADDARAVGFFEEGIPALESEGAVLEGAEQRLNLGRCYWLRRRPDRARAEYERAREALEPAGPSRALAAAYIRLAGMHIFDIEPEPARQLAEMAIAVAEAAGAEDMAIWSAVFVGVALSYEGDLASGRRLLEGSAERALELGYLEVAGNALHNLFAIYLDSLDLDENERLVERLRAIPIRRWRDLSSLLVKNVGALYSGDVHLLLDTADRLAAATDGLTGFVPRAMAQVELDRPQDASAALSAAERPDAELQDRFVFLHARVMLAIAVGDLDALTAHIEWLLSLRDRAAMVAAARHAAAWLAPHATPEQAGDLAAICDRTRTPEGVALAAGIRGFIERDATDIRRGLEIFDRAGCRLVAARLRLWLAEVLGPAGGARDELERVVATARECGSVFAERQARELAEKLGIDLPAAAAEAPPAAKASEEVGERLVTVMFADVRGYTKLTGEQAPAEMADRIAAYQRWAAQAVEHEFGVVDKFAGDAVMATFNASGDQVDHVAHALRAALALRDKAALLGLPVGIGIATGAAVVGRMSKGANLSVLGETTNLAARLQSSARAGEILLSDEAQRRLSDSDGAERVELELKGFERPVVAFRLSPSEPAPAR